jgi:hypothetical protein
MGNSMLARLRAGEPGSVAALFPKGSYRLHAMLTSAGYDRRTGGTYDWHGLRRGEAPFVLLQHTLSGSGRLRYEKRHMEIRAGQTLLLSFPHDDRYWLPRFSRLFAAHEGVSPARYLTRVRMEEAARLLRADPAPIKEIARRSGFSDPNYFGKVFRRYFGIGPRDFRRSGMYSGPADPVSRATAIRRRKGAPWQSGPPPARATDLLACNGCRPVGPKVVRPAWTASATARFDPAG